MIHYFKTKRKFFYWKILKVEFVIYIYISSVPSPSPSSSSAAASNFDSCKISRVNVKTFSYPAISSDFYYIKIAIPPIPFRRNDSRDCFDSRVFMERSESAQWFVHIQFSMSIKITAPTLTSMVVPHLVRCVRVKLVNANKIRMAKKTCYQRKQIEKFS